MPTAPATARAQILVCYFLVMIIVIPVMVGLWWRNSSKFLEDGVMQNTAYRFYRQVRPQASHAHEPSHASVARSQATGAAAGDTLGRGGGVSRGAGRREGARCCTRSRSLRFARPPTPATRAGRGRRGRRSRARRLRARRLRARRSRGRRSRGRRLRRRQVQENTATKYIPGILSSAVEFCEGAACKNNQADDLARLHGRVKANFVKNQGDQNNDSARARARFSLARRSTPPASGSPSELAASLRRPRRPRPRAGVNGVVRTRRFHAVVPRVPWRARASVQS